MPRVTLHIAVRNVPKCTNGHKVITVWIQETHRVPKSQQIKMNVIYMHYFKKTCFPGHDHNVFMVAGAFTCCWHSRNQKSDYVTTRNELKSQILRQSWFVGDWMFCVLLDPTVFLQTTNVRCCSGNLSPFWFLESLFGFKAVHGYV